LGTSISPAGKESQSVLRKPTVKSFSQHIFKMNHRFANLNNGQSYFLDWVQI